MKSILLLGFMLLIGTCSAQTTSSPEGKRFNVDDVQIAPGPLTEMNAQHAFESELAREIRFFPDELKDQTVVPGWGNNFVATIHKSFDQHRPLSFTPDVIWLTIAQGVSIHINENFEELESHIFKTEKPDKIQVRNDSLPNGSVHWVDLLHAFSDSTTKYVNDDYYAFFVPEFSTTTNIDMVSYEVTMLEGFSQAFKYLGDSGCGIPHITLQGNREDWQAIYERLDKIEELGLTVWAEELRMVIQKFIDVFDDNVDVDFWQSIYKDHSEYGAWYVSGWFVKFFPYLFGTGERESVTDDNPYYYARAPKIYIPNKFLEGDQYLISRLSTSDFPSGIAEIDVHWNDWGTNREMKVHAGFYGIKQYEDLTLEPAIAWAVLDKDGSEANHEYDGTNYEVEHRHNYWTPEAMKGKQLEEVAIYNPASFSDSTASYKLVKKKVLAHLKKKTPSAIDDLKGKTVELFISSKGTILKAKGDQVNENLLTEITKAVR
ncbi:MAG: DUF4419 domain-containing protein [Crocinitomicaceae bacterium]|nr:DUF4419 domain-containing protein [Crocinitomicaceae bacterium]